MTARDERSPRKWAIDISQILKATIGEDRFPVDVERVALEYSKQIDPNDAVTHVVGDHLPGYEGGLYPLGQPREGWGIIFNNTSVSTGRRRFTIAHEFGHWLCHRHLIPAEGISCDERSVSQRDGVNEIEREADTFAAFLLMPLDEFRRMIPHDAKPTLEDLMDAAKFFGVSPSAAILRWLEYTNMRAVFVASKDGGMLWARSSKPAMKTGAFFRTRSQTNFVPDRSCVGKSEFTDPAGGGVSFPSGVWFPNEPVIEHSVFIEPFNTALTLLHLENGRMPSFDDEPDDDLLDQMKWR